MNTSQTTIDGQILSPLERIQELNKEKRADLENALLKEALAQSSVNCNDLISKQNTLIEDLTMKVSKLESKNDYNVSELKGSVLNAVLAMKNLQDETKRFNDKISTELSQTVRRTEITLQSNLRQTIERQSQDVFAEVRKELDESKKLLSATREELKLQSKFRKIMFWATPILLFLQTVLTAFLLIK